MAAGRMRGFDPPGAELSRVTNSMWEVADYAERGGYDPGFLRPGDPDWALPLPGAGRWSRDLSPLLPGARRRGDDRHELKYTHFSVKVSRSRRVPLFSAVNIDGSQSDRTVPRTDLWRMDPRISTRHQILREVYGDDRRGFFSRGHMTRREDPNWGDEATAEAADADTFHVTNAAPQRRGFNGGIWLQLEDYILDNTDRENLRVTVVTGPVLAPDDPVHHGVQVPIEYWKILAFAGRDGAPAAIGYKRSQARFLPRAGLRRFVFGDFDDTQVSIAGLAETTGLDLSRFSEMDVMRSADPGTEIGLRSLSDLYLTR